MACSDDQQPNFKHFCKVCKKGFMCGRALGGHMRAHGVGDEVDNLEDGDDPTTDWVSSPETDEDEDGYVGYGGGSGWCKRKRSSRVCCSENEEDIALAKCLMALSNTQVDFIEMEPDARKRNHIFSPVFLSSFTKPPPSPSLDKAKGVVTTATTPKGMFECKACKKVFNSHQALGGHRASHKNVKGCFATRNDQFDENLTDEDVIMHDDIKHSSTGQSDHEPSIGHVPLAGRKSKVHKCSICSRVFASGQALGGHKRCHWLTSNYTSDSYIGKFNFHDHIEQLHQRALAIPKDQLDLNLNLPVSSNAATTTQVPVNTKEDNKHQSNKNIGDQDDHIASTAVESVDGEGESKMKLTKLSELKDMNNTNESSSSWLQVGIGSVANVAPDP